jgi:hypothetical protein
LTVTLLVAAAAAVAEDRRDGDMNEAVQASPGWLDEEDTAARVASGTRAQREKSRRCADG